MSFRTSLLCVIAAVGVLPAFADEPPRVDRYGDPLPEGALARLGTLRLRPRGRIAAVALSADGKLLATASHSEVALWDVASGKFVRSFADPEITIGITGETSVGFSANGQRLICNGFSGVAVWEVASGKLVRSHETAVETPAGCALSRDGEHFAYIDKKKLLHVHETATGRELKLAGRTKPIRAVLFSPSEDLVVTAGEDLRLWDIATGKELRRFKVRPNSIRFSADGKVLRAVHDGELRA